MVDWLNTHVMADLNGVITGPDEPDRLLVKQNPVVKNIIHAGPQPTVVGCQRNVKTLTPCNRIAWKFTA